MQSLAGHPGSCFEAMDILKGLDEEHALRKFEVAKTILYCIPAPPASQPQENDGDD